MRFGCRNFGLSDLPRRGLTPQEAPLAVLLLDIEAELSIWEEGQMVWSEEAFPVAELAYHLALWLQSSNAGQEDDHGVAGVTTASEPSWISPFTGLSAHCFGKSVTVLRREGADTVRRGRPRSLPLEDRVPLVAAYSRTNLTLRELAPLFGVSKSAADRIVDHLGPLLALRPRKRF